MAQMKPFRFPSEGTQQLFESVLDNFVDIPNFPSFSRSVSAADRVASNGLVGVPDQSRPLWGGWKLACLDHKVHCDAEFCQGPEQTPPRKKCECYTVSNLRPFTVQVELQDSHGHTVRDHPPITLAATVIYENGELISLRANENQFDESFPSECLLTSGVATFTLRLGQQVLTDKHQKRNFRIHIRSRESRYAELWVQTVAMRSVVKLPCMRKDRRMTDDPMPPSLALAGGPSSLAAGLDFAALKAEVKREVYEELKADLKEELKANLKAELKDELRDEITADLRRGLERAILQRGNTAGGGVPYSPIRQRPAELIDQEAVIQQLEQAILETQNQLVSVSRNNSGQGQLGSLSRNSSFGWNQLSSRMQPPSRHASDKNPPQEEKRRRG